MLHVVRILCLMCTVLLAGCAALDREKLDQQFGAANPARFDAPLPASHGAPRYSDVRTVVDSRCVVCHACFDAPCQLKLGAWQGITRGASPIAVYDSTRLIAQPPTRLFEDAELNTAWRAMGFHPVLNERANTPAANLDASVLWQMLALKNRQPLPQAGLLPESFDFSLDRSAQCTSIEGFADYARNYPLQGMPFGLPAIAPQEQELLRQWLIAGAPGDPETPQPASEQAHIAQWETFFNGSSNKARLSSRYLYEHLYLAHLHFGDERHFYKLVRSRTPPGQAVDQIVTVRPFDAPGVDRVYYRLIPERETIVSKTHMPYRLDAARMARWQALFLDAPYSVAELPDYDPPEAANPFRSFAAIPVSSRYRFMLDEAQFTVMTFIKGPVCRGQMAVDVIDDQFWVFFAPPDPEQDAAAANYLASAQQSLQLPAELGSNAPLLGRWDRFADLELAYLQQRRSYAQAHYRGAPRPLDQLIWNGDGHNPNAALTVFRHFDNASVQQGLLGEAPQTVWVLTYPLLERIYYLLVAGYDVFGDVGHQLDTRMYMNFMRMEAEQNYLALYPREQHQAIEARWNRNVPQRVSRYLDASRLDLPQPLLPGLEGMSLEASQNKVLKKLHDNVSGLPFPIRTLEQTHAGPLRDALLQLAAQRGATLQYLPEYSVIQLTGDDGQVHWYSLLLNVAHTNVALLFDESARLLPEENTLTVLPGFVASYPNAFWRLREADLPAFTQAIGALRSAGDYRHLVDRFGLRRNAPDFWAHSDTMHAALRAQSAINFGLLDYGRLENR